MDRRHHKRFELQASTHFSWKDSTGVRCQGQGFTRDISETGVFVLTPQCPPSGTTVRVKVRASALTHSGLMMETSGQVVRVEAGQEAPVAAGFAAATRSLKLRNCKPTVTGCGPEYQPSPITRPESRPGRSRKPN